MTEEKRCWYVLYTRPKHEFKAEVQFQGNNILYYLPVMSTKRQWSDRKKKIIEPVFRGYIFIFATEKERLKAISQTSIINSINFNGKPAIVPEEQIEGLKKILEKEKNVFVSEELAVGSRVKVLAGPFEGVTGTVYNSENNERMISITIDLLHRSVSVKLPAESVMKFVE